MTNIPGAPPMYVAWARRRRPRRALRGVRLLASGASPLPPAVLEQVRDRGGHHGPRGVRPDRDRAGGHQHAGLAGRQGRARSAGRSRASRCGWSTRAATDVRRRRPRRDLGPRREPVLRLLAGRQRRPGRRTAGGATGDVAYADDDGDLFLVDRRKELVLVSGFNVYPREVEDALAEHPDVAEVAVIAVPHPYTGEAVKAFVVPARGAAPAAGGRHRARGHPAGPVQVPDDRRRSWPALPHSATGKVAKGRLRERASRRRVTGGRRVTLIGKPGCHLCDDARAVVAAGHAPSSAWSSTS